MTRDELKQRVMHRLAISWWRSGKPDAPDWADNTRVEEILMDLSREGLTAARRVLESSDRSWERFVKSVQNW